MFHLTRLLLAKTFQAQHPSQLANTSVPTAQLYTQQSARAPVAALSLSCAGTARSIEVHINDAREQVPWASAREERARSPRCAKNTRGPRAIEMATMGHWRRLKSACCFTAWSNLSRCNRLAADGVMQPSSWWPDTFLRCSRPPRGKALGGAQRQGGSCVESNRHQLGLGDQHGTLRESGGLPFQDSIYSSIFLQTS